MKKWIMILGIGKETRRNGSIYKHEKMLTKKNEQLKDLRSRLKKLALHPSSINYSVILIWHHLIFFRYEPDAEIL